MAKMQPYQTLSKKILKQNISKPRANIKFHYNQLDMNTLF